MRNKLMIWTCVVFMMAGASAFGGRLVTVPSGTTNDLFGVDYHPSGQYALVVGNGVYTFDVNGLTLLSSLGVFYAVAWHPQGNLALLVGEAGVVYAFDGVNLTPLNSPAVSPLYDVAFSPSGDQAVVVGYGGALLVYENGALTDHSLGGGYFLEGVSWEPNGSSALIVGILNFAFEEVIRWDRSTAVVEWSGPAVWPGDIAHHPTDGYALIIEDWGHAAVYDTNGYQQIVTGFEQQTDGLNSVEWSPDGSMALITGAWYHSPMPGKKTLVEFDGQRFNTLRMFETGSNFYEDLSWKSDGSEALVVGRQGELARYVGNVKVMSSIYCDSDRYSSGDTMQVFLDVENHGPFAIVDGYITLTIDFGQPVYWPGFTPSPVPIAKGLPRGISVQQLKFFERVIPSLSSSVFAAWELWIFTAGQIDYDHLYSYSTFSAFIDP